MSDETRDGREPQRAAASPAPGKKRVAPGRPSPPHHSASTATARVEVDGASHVGRGPADAQRDAFLRSRGLMVIRVTNDDVLRDLDAVCEFVLRAAQEGGAGAAGSIDPPTP